MPDLSKNKPVQKVKIARERNNNADRFNLNCIISGVFFISSSSDIDYYKKKENIISEKA